MSTSTPWGGATQFFFSITPERVLAAVESAGVLCTGRVSALGSMENRVYEVEIELDGETPKTPSDRFRIVKFYRPGRWSAEQIGEEHRFLAELKTDEIPVVAPLPFSDGTTLRQDKEGGIFFAVFPKVGGRAPDEFSAEQLRRLGRLLARIHGVGSRSQAPSRVRLVPDVYGRAAIESLSTSKLIPPGYQAQIVQHAEALIEKMKPKFESIPLQRIHGDCHLGNLLWNKDGPFFLDFDDMVVGPPVQDVWMLVPGREPEAEAERAILVEAYEELRGFDRTTLALIEPLRALRLLHFNGWVCRRWEDPAFPRNFPQFETDRHWESLARDLENLL